MREILFRAKGDTEYNDGDWYYGVPIQCYDGDWQICTDALRRTVILETIGEYTGLTDKNGTKIFEGDIANHYVQGKILVNRGIIEWSDKDACWSFNINNHYHGEGHPLVYFNSEAWGVIGNIYDNPELLEVNMKIEISAEEQMTRPKGEWE